MKTMRIQIYMSQEDDEDDEMTTQFTYSRRNNIISIK